MAVKYEIINKAGAWFSYEGTKIGQGRENTKEFLKNNPSILEEITAKVINDYDLSNKASYEIKTNDLLDVIKSSLETDEKEIIIRHVLEGYSLKEIAKITYQNINTVKSKYRRALLKLKHLLKEKNL